MVFLEDAEHSSSHPTKSHRAPWTWSCSRSDFAGTRCSQRIQLSCARCWIGRGAFVIDVTTAILIVLLGVAAAVAVILYRRWQQAAAEEPGAAEASSISADTSAETAAADAPYSTDAIQAAQDECYKIAFGVKSFDYQIFGEHAAVMDRVRESVASAVNQRGYFPRRPMLLPKLMQALNDSESSRRTLVNLIVEDPSLAGSVLQRAKNAMYRTSREPVDSLDRAVQILGIDGLRGLMAVAILQPVFRLPPGLVNNFADVPWEQAQRCAAAAETYATATRSADMFIAQLLGLLGPLARIVLFRLTMDMYREQPNVLPRAEVFIRSMQLHAPELACRIAESWELSDLATSALREQVDRLPPGQMRPLGRAAYFGELAGMAT
ncbi:MAG TPA: HDOD domain-containing protein, partial [Steroidobacteraceae bacterium]|nr:HDOD domain-containing protein [Steroidobacteraceae bacterium]